MATDIEVFVELQKKAIEAAEAKKAAELATQNMLSSIVNGLGELKSIVTRNSEQAVALQTAVVKVATQMNIVVDYLRREKMSIEEEYNAERDRTDQLHQMLAKKETGGVHITNVGQAEGQQTNIGGQVKGDQK